jgi:hypothetical protein
MKLTRTLIVLVFFGIAFAYVEAAVVVYLRIIHEPIRQEAFRGLHHDAVLPLLSWEQLQASGPDYIRVLRIETSRELATLVLLTTIGLAIGETFREHLASFMIAFGIWDIFYYGFLRFLIAWPASLWTWDILFLLPVPWVGPVIAPMLISASMIVAGGMILWRESLGQPIRCGRLNSVLVILGGLVVIVAFCWDFRNTAVGGWPHPFNWPLFAVGETMAAAGFVHALVRRGSI